MYRPFNFILYGAVDTPLSAEILKMVRAGYYLEYPRYEDEQMSQEDEQQVRHLLFHEPVYRLCTSCNGSTLDCEANECTKCGGQKELPSYGFEDQGAEHHLITLRSDGILVNMASGEVVGRL